MYEKFPILSKKFCYHIYSYENNIDLIKRNKYGTNILKVEEYQWIHNGNIQNVNIDNGTNLKEKYT